MRVPVLLIPMLFIGFADAQSPALVGYWQNWNDASAPYLELDQIDPRYNVIGIAFAEPAAGTTYDMVFTPSGTPQGTFIAQVAALHASGRKVLISIGGANATVHLNSDTERDQFRASMLAIIATYGFDGVDIDLEGASVSITGGTISAPVDAPLLRLIDAIEGMADDFELTHGVPMTLTMAPETAFVQGGQSAFGGIWGAYLPLIHALRDRIDILQVQLYNSGSMYGIDGGIYAQGTADFIVSQVEAVIQGFPTSGGNFIGLEAQHVAVGLPACASAAGGGYTDTTIVRAAVEYLLGTGPQPGSYTLGQPGGYPMLRGMMTWSINWDAASACNGANSYAENYERIFGDISTTIVDHPLPGSITITPNPASDRITIRGVDCSICSVSILDLSGRIIRSERLALKSTSLAIADLLPGTYLLRIEGGSNTRTIRFMKV
ncbi:MAG: T9SS type A sorting domain-containing protein [Flavobacteriales bacterium]|nr:T9SS type A sorting domain-containing protein [Flavobacteriales bacterium]